MKKAENRREIFLVLDNIRSVFNVGSIFRTADAAGVDKIFLLGVTPTPLERFGRPRKDFAKVARGAAKTVAWEEVENGEGSAAELLQKLRGAGVTTVAIEQSPRAVDFKKVKIAADQSVAFIFGNEVGGVSKEILDSCNTIAEIPMRGKKESLNVSVTAGVALFGML